MILTGQAGEARRRVPLVVLVILGVVAAGVVVRVVTPQGGEPGVLAVTRASEAPSPSPGPLRAPRPRRSASPRRSPAPRPPPSPLAEVGVWEELPGGPLRARSEPVGVWTGHELLVWGGAVAAAQGPGQAFVAEGAAYDPATGAWRILAPSPLEGRSGAAAVWTGTELVVWGGLGATAHLGDGARYDPAADDWTPLPAAPLSPRSAASAVWTGREVVVLGGQDNAGPRAEAAAFDPAAGAWRPLPPLPPRSWGFGEDAVWTGERLVVATVGTEGPAGEAVVMATGAALDGWTALPSPQETVGGIAVEADRGRVYATVSDVNGRGPPALWFLEPGAETWTATAAAPQAINAWQDRLVGTDGGVVAVRPDAMGSGARYHAEGDRWERLARQPSLGREGGAEHGQVLAWTGDTLLVWGGFDGTTAAPTLRALRLPAPG